MEYFEKQKKEIFEAAEYLKSKNYREETNFSLYSTAALMVEYSHLKPVEIPEITETKLTEGQKLRICELLEESLNGVRLQNYKTDDDDNLPLVDLLSTGDTILEGQEEITNIVEQIFFDMDNWNISLKVPNGTEKNLKKG